MKRRIAILLVVLALMGSSAAWAVEKVSDDYDDSITHPLRLASYVVHPIGFAVEWLIGRPIHYIISRPHLDRVFGYQPYDEETFRRYGSSD